MTDGVETAFFSSENSKEKEEKKESESKELMLKIFEKPGFRTILNKKIDESFRFGFAFSNSFWANVDLPVFSPPPDLPG
jgi:hypothetical protein